MRSGFLQLAILVALLISVKTSYADDRDAWSLFVPNEKLLLPRIISLGTDTSGSVLYVGTAQGLNRKEGKDIRSHGKSVRLPHGAVEDVTVDIWNRPWCIVNGQVYIFTTYLTRKKEKVSVWYPCPFGGLDSLQGVRATCMARGPLDIVIGTNSGLIYSKNITGVKDTSSTGFELPTRVLPEGDTIFDIVHWKGSYYFLSTSKGLFKLFNGRIKGVQRISNESVIRGAAIQSDTVSKIWFADTGYVGQIDTSRSASIVNIVPLANVHSMCFDSIGHLWCATDTALFEVYPQELVFVQHPLPTKPKFIIGPLLALSKDSILVGTDKGLFLFKPPRLPISMRITSRSISDKGVSINLRVDNYADYPYILLKWKLVGETDWTGWKRYSSQADYKLDIGKVGYGKHELQIVAKPPMIGIAPTSIPCSLKRNKPFSDWVWVISGFIIVTIIFSIFYLIRRHKIREAERIKNEEIKRRKEAIRRRREKIVRLRKAKAKLKENPYIVGPPIRDEEKFIGRKKILDEVLGGVQNNCFLIYGERRLGKTSLLYQIRNKIRALEESKYKVEPIMVHLEKLPGKKTKKNFYTNLTHVIARALYKRTIYTKILEQEYDYSAFDLFMETLLEKMRRKYPDQQVRVILLLDEGDIMTKYGPTFHSQFRGIFQSSYARYFNVVLALKEFNDEWREVTSPWYNFFTPEELKPMTRDETYTLITKYVEGAVEYSKGALKKIWDITQGHPYMVQKLCSEIYNSLGDRVYVRLRDVENKAGSVK